MEPWVEGCTYGTKHLEINDLFEFFTVVMCFPYIYTMDNLSRILVLSSEVVLSVNLNIRGGCGAYFFVRHSLSCIKVGLVHEKLLYLAWKSFPSSAVQGEPILHHGRSRSEREIIQGSVNVETRGDVLIRYLWGIYTNAIINVKLRNAHTDTHRFGTMVTLLAWWDKMKNYNHDKHYHKQWKHCSPFILSVDGMLGRDSFFVLSNLIPPMEAKIDEPILHV